MKTSNKYGNKKVEYDGFIFDSIKEKNRFQELKLLEKAGMIGNLKLQPKFDLIVNEKKIGRYTADFQYRDEESNKIIVEDVKSKPTITQAFSLRKRVFEAVYPDLKLVIV